MNTVDNYCNDCQLIFILYFFMINISNDYYIKMNTVDNYCNDCQLIFICILLYDEYFK